MVSQRSVGLAPATRRAIACWLAAWILVGGGRSADAAEEAVFVEPCQTDCGVPCRLLDPLGQEPAWTGRVDALLLWRDAPQSTRLYDFVDPETGDPAGTALNASSFASGMAAGPRFALFRDTGDLGAIEFNFLRVQSFTASRSLPLLENGYFDAPPRGLYCCDDLTPRDAVEGTLSSSLQSAEINRRFPTNGRLGWLMGFRWVEWNDGLGLESLTVPDLAPPFTTAYRTQTSNDLYGLQIGADSILFGLGGPFRVEGIGKAGIFYNDASQSSRFSTTDPAVEPDVLAVRTNTGRAAFVGELGVTGVYDLTDRISLRAGYAIFWLGGLAMAPAQFEVNKLCPENPIEGATDTGGSVVVQGLSLGLEGRW
jgi:hypothetical protein